MHHTPKSDIRHSGG